MGRADKSASLITAHACALPLISAFWNDIRVQLQDLKANMMHYIIITCRRNADRLVHGAESGICTYSLRYKDVPVMEM